MNGNLQQLQEEITRLKAELTDREKTLNTIDTANGGTSRTMDAHENEIHVSALHLVEPMPSDLERSFFAELPLSQQQAILCLERWQDRQSSLLGRMLLRRALSLPHGGSGQYSLHMLCQTQQGRPVIAGGPDFNISHSGATVVLAVCSCGRVGIDIEAIRSIEYAQLRNIVPEWTAARRDAKNSSDLRLFYDYWTRKEAVAKGCGFGLAAPFEQLDVSRDVVAAAGSVWHLRSLSIGGEDMSCHIATNVPPSRILVEPVTKESLPAR